MDFGRDKSLPILYVFLCTPLFCLLLGVLLVPLSRNQLSFELEAYYNGTEETATIAEVYEDRDYTKDYYVSYTKYVVEYDGVKRDLGTSPHNYRYEVGDTVPVTAYKAWFDWSFDYYDRMKPSPTGGSVLLILMLAFFSVLFDGIGLIGILSAKRIQRDGELVYATVKEIKIEEYYSGGELHMKCIIHLDAGGKPVVLPWSNNKPPCKEGQTVKLKLYRGKYYACYKTGK